MHNSIMVAGSRDRPPMLAMGKYAQWQSCFMRYVDTKPNGVETFSNISPENKAHYDAEKEAIHLLLTRTGDEIYSNVDACKTAHDIWIAIERLQQGESLNKQDLEVATMQVNVQFLQQLQLEWSRFMTIVKQIVDLDKGSYQKFFDILKQYQKEVNEIRTEKIAKNANPLALVVAGQQTSSNSRNKNVDTTPRYVNKNQTGQFGNQRTVTVAGSRETVGSLVVQQTGIQCFNCKEFRYFAKECRKPKRAKDYTYHKEKMLCEQAEKESGSDAEPLEKSALEKCKSSLGESNRTRDRYLVALHDKEVELEKYKIFKDRTIENDTLERKFKETLGLLAQKEYDIQEGLKIKAYEVSIVKEKHDELVKQGLLTKSSYEGLVKEKNKVIKDLKLKEEKDLDKLIAMEKQLKFLNEIIYKRNQSIQTILLAPKVQHIMEDQLLQILNLLYVQSLETEIDELKTDKADFSNIYDLLLQKCVSKDVMCSYLHSLSDLDAHTELQCLYLHKVKECECLAEKLSKQTKTVIKEVYNEVLMSFAKLEQHSISLEIALQQC
ncbi:hypothetical protein Tco_0839617 [Tanacetum coccineum]|uniref:CCHC-type domain-containing protein n=1 Tax=Tanacetum coccineum TaxID=301880 RepID=A0ABQ5AR54_9ASTR